mmetsp:Transcript_1255/g.2617  ORF Transcript_1255/g.2617 Transcript_1255/m.2617 type:complete len:293 (+) Transcript_1255:210-1088(+)
MPPIQNTDAKTAPQQNHINSGDQRNKKSNGVISNGTKNNSTNNNNTHYSQQLIRPHNRRMGPQPTVTTVPMSQYSGAAAAVSTSSSHRFHHHPPNSAASQPTPLFQRLHSEEVQSVHQELKAYKRIVESQNLRLLELEKIHEDLEKRLELESRGRRQLETTLERRERDWTIKLHTLEKDIDHWENEVSNEQAKNTRLRDQVVRKDQDIHRMLQRKVRRNVSPNLTRKIHVFKIRNVLIRSLFCSCAPHRIYIRDVMVHTLHCIMHYADLFALVVYSKKISMTTKENLSRDSQ